MSTYAEGTTVSVENSRAEIEKLLRKHGASFFAAAQDNEHHRAMVLFVVGGAKYKLDIPLPTREQAQAEIRHRTQGNRDPDKHREQRERERWRAVLLMLKAKLELVALGVSTIDKEFMSQLVVHGSHTLGEVLPLLIQGGLLEQAKPMLGQGDTVSLALLQDEES